MCGGGGGNDSAERAREQEYDRRRQLQEGLRELEGIFAPYRGQENQYQGPLSTEGGGIMSQEAFQDYLTQTTPDLMQTQSSYLGRPLTVEGFNPEALDQATLESLGLSGEQAQSVLGNEGLNDLSDLYHALRYDESLYTMADSGDPIWSQTRQSYLDFAEPQLRDQYGSSAEDLTYALARGGQLTGSVGAENWTDLNRQFGERRADLASEAERQAKAQRQDIANLESDFRNQLLTSSNPSLDGTGLQTQLESIASTPSFSSLGPLFQNVTANLAGGMQGQQQYQTNQMVDSIMSRNPSAGSGRVVR